jgi:hypothetical protein
LLSAAFVLFLCNPANASTLTITTTSPLPSGTVDTFYSTVFSATGGAAPYAWTITSGSVPGLAISSTGALSGVPNAASTYTVTVQVMDSATTPATATATFNLTTAVSSNTNYYVSTSGSDSNNGSASAPWRTIAYAVTKAGPGITINVAAGTYSETADIAINTGGSLSGGYFILRSSGGPSAAVIDGTNVPIGTTGYAYGLVNLTNVSYVTIDGFGITNFKTGTSTKTNTLVPAGISVQGSGANIQLVNNSISNIWNQGKATNHTGNCPSGSPNALGLVAVGTNGTTPLTNISIIGNTLTNLMTGCSESMTVNGNTNGFIVAKNVVHNNSNIGIGILGGECVASGVTCTNGYDGASNDQARNGEVYGNTVYEDFSDGTGTTPHVPAASNPYGSACYCDDGIYLDGSASNIVERNTVYLVDLGIEVTGEGAAQNTTNNVVRDNLFFYNNAVGISLGGQGTSGGSANSTVLNNTTWSNGVNSNAAMGEFATGTKLTGTNVVENNIFYASAVSGTLVQAQTTSNLTLNHNLYYAPSSAQNWCWKYNGSTGNCGTTYTSFASYQSGTKQDANSQFADPLFVNINVTPPNSLPNLNVQSGSTARGAGTILSPASLMGPFDVAGATPRILVTNHTIDIGAYEQ